MYDLVSLLESQSSSPQRNGSLSVEDIFLTPLERMSEYDSSISSLLSACTNEEFSLKLNKAKSILYTSCKQVRKREREKKIYNNLKTKVTKALIKQFNVEILRGIDAVLQFPQEIAQQSSLVNMRRWFLKSSPLFLREKDDDLLVQCWLFSDEIVIATKTAFGTWSVKKVIDMCMNRRRY